jgi:hypothetical protein
MCLTSHIRNTTRRQFHRICPALHHMTPDGRTLVPARNRAPASSGRREGSSAVPPRVGSSPRGTARRSSAPASRVRPDRFDASPGTETLVVGDVPLLARLAGGLLALAGVLAGVAAFLTYLVVGGVAVSPVTGPVDALVALVAPVATVVVGAVLALGRVPRLGLAYAAVAGLSRSVDCSSSSTRGTGPRRGRPSRCSPASGS